jgi:hypothetical protein
MMKLSMLVVLLWSMTWPVFAGQVIHDGDTLRLDGVRVRLWGMDAPELGAMCLRGEHTYDGGAAAREALAGLVGGRAVECAQVGHERSYNRIVARCSVDGLDLSGAMVRGRLGLRLHPLQQGPLPGPRKKKRVRLAGGCGPGTASRRGTGGRNGAG